MKASRALFASALAASLAACVADPYYDTAYADPYGPRGYYAPPAYGPAPGTGTTLGTVGGAVAGGLLGSTIGSGSGQVAATVGGAVLGGLLGGSLGRNLDEQNRRSALVAQQRAFATNAPATWGAPGTAAYGTVQPLRTYMMDGRYCREYLHTVFIDGRAQDARGTACQMADGTWQIIS